MSNFKHPSTTISEKYRHLKDNLKIVEGTGNAAKICDSHLAYQAIFYIYKLLQDEQFLENNHRWSFLNENLSRQIVELWIYMLEVCEGFDTKNWNYTIEESEPMKKTNLNQRKLSIFKYLIEITYTVTKNAEPSSFFEFNILLFNADLIKTLLSFYKKKKFLSKSTEAYDVHIIMIAITGIIRNLSELTLNDHSQKEKWKDLEVDKTLQGFDCKYNIVYSDMTEQIITNINQKSIKESISYLEQAGDAFERLLILVESKRF